MTNWTSPGAEKEDTDAWTKFLHVMIGLYIWEIIVSFDFDFAYVTGERMFRWPIIFYFCNRYFMLFTYIGVAVALNVTKPINCNALYTYMQIFGNMSIGLASINLSIRTMAIWMMSLYVVVPLVLLILGQWSVLLHGILVKAHWINGSGCVVSETNNTLLAVTFIYSMCFDFIVLVLTTWGLAMRVGRSASSRIATLIFKDGLIHFITAFLVDTIAVVFMLLDPNPVMSIIMNNPAAALSSVVACRVVRRLASWHKHDIELISVPVIKTGPSRLEVPVLPTSNRYQNQVHVQMETFVHVAEDVPSAPSSVLHIEQTDAQVDECGDTELDIHELTKTRGRQLKNVVN